MLIPVVLALLTAAAPPQDTARGVIRGTVSSEPTGLPVPLAVVEADNGRQTVHAISDSTGAYRLRVAAGRQVLRIRHLEHASLEVEVLVPAGGETPLDVALEHRPIALAPVRVLRPGEPGAEDSVAAARPDVGMVIDHRTVQDGGGLGSALNPGFLLDPADAGGGAGEVLYVRGSAANMQLVLLDGAPVYAPFHMGGLIETFEPDVVRSARLYLGGAPARYDGGLSYVMDLSTRSGRDQAGAAGTLDMVSAGARVEGPLGPARYLASVRTVHGASLGRLEGDPFPYAFADGLARVDLPLAGGDFSATVFANLEGVRVDTLAAGRDGHAQWGNLAGSLRYHGRLEGADLEMTVAAGRFDADLPLRDGSRLFVLRGRSDRLRAGMDFTRTAGAVLLRYGGSVERTWIEHRADQPAAFRSLIYAHAAGSSAGGYLDATWQPVGRVLLRGGVRADAFSVGGVATLAPRASATWLLSDEAALTLAGGRYHQFVRMARPLPPGSTLNNYVDTLRLGTHLAVAGATHLSLGLDQQMGRGVRLGLEGFYKRYHGIPTPEGVDTLSTTAHASGMDVWVRRTAGTLTGWFGYSLNWTWSSEGAVGAAGQFTGRQTVSAGVRGLAWRRSMLAVRFAYGAGLPHAAITESDRALGSDGIPTFGQNNSTGQVETDAPLRAGSQPFLRLDAELSRTWRPRLAGRRTQVTPYLRIINALDRRDGLFYRYFSDGAGASAGTGTRMEAVGTLPVLPVLGFNWKF